ncbi:meiosis-specific protein ASY2-like [Raphanus sativus]|uniref:Meiosis-specific protein ASY2-like n=1 Tax=Raphanus sativus TaxID=3726 RepID=A0A9W3DRK0_RAPSA|nr:meiosis-specific protein ASY2-like [Raphanus sativus]
MSTSKKLSREQKGKMRAASSGSGDDLETVRGSEGSQEAVHREAMMDTENLSRAQRVLISESRVQSRKDDDGRDHVDDQMIPISFYPGNIFEKQPPLDRERVRPSVVEGQDWRGVEKTRSTVESVTRLLRARDAAGVTFIIPNSDQRPWSPPKGYQCVYESYFEGDTKLWFPIPRIVTAFAMRRGAALSQFLNGAWRLAVALTIIGAEAGVPLNVRAFEELVSAKIKGGLISLKIRPNYNVVTGYPNKTNNWQRSYFYVKSDRAAFEEPLRTGYRVLWAREMVALPNTAEYEEDFLTSARLIASQRQDHWNNFSYRRISRSIGWISQQVWRSDTIPIVTNKTKRVNLFNSAEQREINRARAMRTIPNLSLVVAKKVGSAKKSQPDTAGSPNLGDPSATESDAEAQLVRKTNKKRQREEEGAAVEETNVGASSPQGHSGSEGRRKKARGDSPAIRSSSVEEGELRDLEPSGGSKDEVVPESQPAGSRDEDLPVVSPKAKKKDKKRKRKKKAAEMVPRGSSEELNDEEEDATRSGESLGPGREVVPEEPAPQVAEGTVAVPKKRKKKKKGCPDRVSFSYDREVPLAHDEQECGRLVRQFRGDRGALPPVKDLIFKEEYKFAARTSIMSLGDWNVLVRKYDEELRGAFELVDKQKRSHKRAKDEAVAQEEALRKELDEQRGIMAIELASARDLVKKAEKEKAELRKRNADLQGKNATLEKEVVASALNFSREMDRLRESRKLEVTHERIRVMAAMTGKCSRRFKNIQDREKRRDDFEDSRCMLGQARGMRDCLEALKESGKDIPQETIDTYADLEKYYDGETTRLEVGVIPDSDLTLSPLVLKSRFVIEEILEKVDKHGSNLELIDSEAAAALRSPSDGFIRDLLDTVQSPARPDATLPIKEAAPDKKAVEVDPKAPGADAREKLVTISDSSSLGTSDPDASEGLSDPNREIRLASPSSKGQSTGNVSSSGPPEKKDPPAEG